MTTLRPNESTTGMPLSWTPHCISAIVGTEMVPFKENLNLKAQGGSSFAPYFDTPSLRVALVTHGINR